MTVMAERRRVDQPATDQPRSPLEALWPAEDRPLTVDDLERLPDDGNRYELVDGILHVTPSPYNNHQFVVTRLTMILGSWCPIGLDLLGGPGINLASDLHRIPDLVVVPRMPLESAFVTKPLLLAIEVASRSTQQLDRTSKKQDYAAFGIESYWIVVTDQDRPSVTAFELRGTKYEQIALAAGDESFEAMRPFPVTLVPSVLVADGDEWRSLIR